MDGSWQQLAWTLLWIALACAALAGLGLLLIAQRIRRLRIPPDADFFSTMRMVPLSLVILLDLLDFGLDIFSAPIMWVVLSRMGLPNLRNKATIEALIPISGPIPTFTIAWIAARMFDLGSPWRAMPAQRDLRIRDEDSSYDRLRRR